MNKLILVFLILIIGTSCSSQKIKTDYIELPGKKISARTSNPHSMFDEDKAKEEVRTEKPTVIVNQEESTPDVVNLDSDPTENSDNVDYLYYTVKEGDNLRYISKKLYSNKNRWKEIAELNSDQIKNPNRIYKGMKLKFVPDPGHENESHAEIYIVKKGDSLSKISKKVFGTYWKWNHLHEKNKDSVKDPNILTIGQKIKI